MRLTRVLLALTIIALLLVSCSGNTGNTLAPSSVDTSRDFTTKVGSDALPSSGFVMGVWDVYIDTENLTAEAFPLRHASFTGNQNFHAPPGMLKLDNIVINFDTGEIEADIGLEHKFPALKRYTGFDVMGVFMGDGNALYPGDYNLAIHGINDQRLLNADGYTRWFNPNEFKGADEVPPMFGYNPGHMGTPGYKPTADLNGYKYYTDGLGLDEDEFQFLMAHSDERGMLTEGSLVWRHYSMIFPALPLTGEAKFQYAVIGHWEPNKHEPGPPCEVPGDFPPEANVDEAVVCDIEDFSTAWWEDGEFGGNVILDISPWDWSATCDAGTMGEYMILIYSDAWGGPYEVDMTCLGWTEFHETFHAEIPIETLDSCDPLEVWVEVRYPDKDYTNDFGAPNTANGDLAGYFLLKVPVSCEAPVSIEVVTPNGGEDIWWGDDYEITWTSQYLTGLVNIEYSKDDFVSNINVIATDETDDGSFLWEDVPIDISDTVKVRVSSVDFPAVQDESDDYFSIVDHGWARNWGGVDQERCYWSASDGSGYTYSTGFFNGTVDFDPGSDEDIHTSNSYDNYLSKIDSSGNLVWAHTWGSNDSDTGAAVEMDAFGNVFVVGNFRGTADFDPGPNEYWLTSIGSLDPYISKFDSSGNFLWAKNWGCGYNDEVSDVSVDGSGNVYVVGYFQFTVDFDPGIGVDYQTSNGSGDSFVSKFDASGNYLWSRTWGGIGGEPARGVASDESGNVFIGGSFQGIVDFDPSGNEDLHTAKGEWDNWLSKFDAFGNYVWSKAWGGDSNSDLGFDVEYDNSGYVYTTGRSEGLVDFDPSDNEDWQIGGAFLMKLGSSGNYVWTKTWGPGDGYRIAVGESGNIYVSGVFSGIIDFDPGPDTDNHISNGAYDAYLSKFDKYGTFLWAETWGGAGNDWGNGVGVDSFGNAYAAGYFMDTVDFDPCDNEDWHTSNGIYDVFLIKFMPDGCW